MGALVKMAAKETLKWPIHVAHPLVPEFRVISAQNLHRLQEFHHACARQIVRAILDSRVCWQDGPPDVLPNYIWWTEAAEGDHSEGCGAISEDIDHEEVGYVGTQVTSATWFNEHMRRIQPILEKCPDGASITRLVCDFTRPLLTSIAACSKCAERAAGDLSALAEELSRDVAVAQEEVRDSQPCYLCSQLMKLHSFCQVSHSMISHFL
jgi:hypothetical protein